MTSGSSGRPSSKNIARISSTFGTDRITAEVDIPTIGIGASSGCDGQILVVDDMLGLFTAFKAKFVKRYAELGAGAEAAIASYAEEVRARRFPGPEHVFSDAAPGSKAAQ